MTSRIGMPTSKRDTFSPKKDSEGSRKRERSPEGRDGPDSKRSRGENDDMKAKQPADLEELIETQRNEEGGAKPKFLSKAERRALALQKRQEQVAAVQQQQEQDRQLRMQFFDQAKSEHQRKSHSFSF